MAEPVDRALGEAAARLNEATSGNIRGDGEVDLGDSRSLAEAWVADLKRQIARLEREVDSLHEELREQRAQHAEELRRKDVLLQGAQLHISTLTDRLKLLPPPNTAPSQRPAVPGREGGRRQTTRRPPNFEVLGWPVLDL